MSLLLLALLACDSRSDPDTAEPVEADADTDADADPCEGITPVVTELTVHELAEMMDARNVELINVHIPYAGEITGTDASIAYSDVDAIEAHLGGDIGAPAVLYCLTGPMSAQAAAALVSRGYCQIYDVPEALTGWASAGYDTTGY